MIRVRCRRELPRGLISGCGSLYFFYKTNVYRGGIYMKKNVKWFCSVLIAGAVASGSVLAPVSTFADEETEKQERITLNFGDRKDETETEPVTEAVTETEAQTEPETYEAIENVKTDQAAIVTTDVSEIVEAVMPSVVSITLKSVEEISDFYGGTYEQESLGSASGVIVAQNKSELLIATNSHVVADAEEVSVGFAAEAENPEDLIVSAKIKGTDVSHELAIIAVQLGEIPEEIRSQIRIAKLGKSSELKVGQPIIAIGNALGYGLSVTSGIVSALSREESKNEFENYEGTLIQTDAAINLGNSGGPWLNANGEVVGINLGKIVGAAADNIGYAIPIDLAVPVLEDLINRETRDKLGNLERGYLGVSVIDVSDDAKELYDIPVGAFVQSVNPGSAGEAAGIQKGDVITYFDGISVRSSSQLVDTMQYYKVGETITVTVMTANNGVYESREVIVTLQESGETASAKKDQPAAGPEDSGTENEQDGQDPDERSLQDYLEELIPYGEDLENDFNFFGHDW